MRHAETAMDKEYQAEDDVRTLIRAGAIKKDKARLKRAKAKAKEQMADLEYVGMPMEKMNPAQYRKARKKMDNTDHYPM